jgi:L-rhamnose-H+ transport protein
MGTNLGAGILLVAAAGAMAGNCMLPLKGLRRWKWENAWLVFTLVTLVVVPWIVAAFSIPDLAAVYAACSARDLLPPLLFGFGWGIAQVLFGISIANLGMALGFAVIIGLGSTFGTLVPILVQRPEVLFSSRGALLAAGLATMLGGTAVCGYAGRQRERAGGANAGARRAGYGGALLLAIVCGVMAPMINFGFAFGGGIVREALRLGTPPESASFAVWPAVLAGGLAPNVVYAVYLLSKNRKWGQFRLVWPDLGYSAAAGLLWIGATLTYGIATRFLGALGTSAGWGLYQILMILTANLAGLLSGEWARSGKGSLRTLASGLLLLGAATVLLAVANR